MATTVYSDALICTQALQLPTHYYLRLHRARIPVVENSAEGLHVPADWTKLCQVSMKYIRRNPRFDRVLHNR